MARPLRIREQAGRAMVIAVIAAVIVLTVALAVVHHDRQRLEDLCAGLPRGASLGDVTRRAEALPGVRILPVNTEDQHLIILHSPLVPGSTACEVRHDGLGVVATRMTAKP
jgi:hypothetical protein